MYRLIYLVRYNYRSEFDRKMVNMNIISVDLRDQMDFLSINYMDYIDGPYNGTDDISYYIDMNSGSDDKFYLILRNSVRSYLRDESIGIIIR